MIQISLALALIAIVFGAKLLAQHKKDGLGAMYKYIAWFVIGMGFLIILCDGAKTIRRCCPMMGGHKMIMREECMMRDGDCDAHGMMGGGQSCPMMMNHCNHGNMNCGNDPCCKMMMNQCMGNNNCCSGGMNCNDGNMSCKDGGNGACKDGMPANCPMNKGGMQCKADSGKDKK